MKITCAECGKRFDGEEHMYICPKCNHYHSQTGVHNRQSESVSSLDLFRENTKPKDLLRNSKKKNPLDSGIKGKFKDKLDGVNVMDMLEDIIIPDNTRDGGQDTETEFVKSVKDNQTVYTAQKAKPETASESTMPLNLFKRIAMGIGIVVGCIIFIIGPFTDELDFDGWFDESDYVNNEWGSSYTEENSVGYGTPMEFETFTVYVEDVFEPEFEGLEVKDGYRLVQVNFDTESDYEYESGDIITDVTLLHIHEDDDGSYTEDWYAALYEDEVTSDSSYEKELRDAGLVIEAHYSGEYFWIFEIPEDTEDLELRISTLEPEEESSGSYVENECFRMPVEL